MARAGGEMDRDGGIKRPLVLCTLTLIFCMPAIFNGTPFVYIDTATYLAQGQEAARAFLPWLVPDGAAVMPTAMDAPPVSPIAPPDAEPVVGGRSIYYGLAAYAAAAMTGGWALVTAQALALAWPILLIAQRVAGKRWIWVALATCLVAAFGTPAGVFVGLITPDIWAAAMVLAVAALTVSRSLGRGERAGLYAVIAYAGSVHTSHLLVLALAALVFWAIRCVRRGRSMGQRPFESGLTACVAIGVAGSLVFGAVVEQRYGAPPISRPHLTARLIDSGPGAAAANEVCAAGSDLAICAHLDRIPQRWTSFLFDPDPASGVFDPAPPAEKRALAADDKRFAVMTFRHAPFTTTWTLIRDAGRQVLEFDVYGTPTTTASRTDAMSRFSSDLQADIQGGRSFDQPGLFAVIDTVHRWLTGAALAVAALAFGAAAFTGCTIDRRAALVFAVCVGGVLLNAVVCGALASPYGRFGARIAWLIVLTAPLLTASLLQALPTRRKVVLS